MAGSPIAAKNDENGGRENNLKQSITQLEKEILDLEETFKERADQNVRVTKEELNRLKDQYQEKAAGEKHKLAMRHLEDNIKLNSILTNIDFKRKSKNTTDSIQLQEGGQAKNHVRSIGGLCEDVPFTVNFDVLEKLSEEDTSSQITKMNVDVDGEAFANLTSILPSLEEKKDLQGFFIFIQSYCEAVEKRKKILTDFETEFRDSVKVVSGAGSSLCIHMINHNRPREIWKIIWDLEVTSLYKVTPHIYLELGLQSKSGDEESKAEAVKSTLPELFQKLMTTHGIENALRTIFELAVLE